MNLRERCEKLCKKMDVTAFPCVELVESFARQIRAEAIEECAKAMEMHFHPGENRAAYLRILAAKE